MELLEKYKRMETEQNNLKNKLNDLEKNRKALEIMTYPKTIKPRKIIKAKRSVALKGTVQVF